MKRFQLVGCDVTSKHTLRASLLFYFVVASELSIVFACIFRLLLLENPTVEDFKDAFIFLPILLQVLNFRSSYKWSPTYLKTLSFKNLFTQLVDVSTMHC